MDAHKLQLKIFLSPDSARMAGVEAFIPVFHRWIKDRILPELVIDVANYAHVPKGPGVVLIGHGSDYFLDQGEGRPGLLHNRKRAGFAAGERLGDLTRRTLHAAALLEREPAFGGKLRFATGELLFRVNDRLLAPNTPETLARLRPELEALAGKLYGGGFKLAPAGGPKDLFGVRITSAAPPALASMLAAAGGPPAGDASLVA